MGALLAKDDLADSGHAIGIGVMPAACENLADTPIMTMSRTLLARKQSPGSHVIDRTVLSVVWRRLITKLLAACHEEHTHLGHNILLGVMKMPLHMLDPCSHARLDVTASACALLSGTELCFLEGRAAMCIKLLFRNRLQPNVSAPFNPSASVSCCKRARDACARGQQ